MGVQLRDDGPPEITVTPAAVAAFRTMLRLEPLCECGPRGRLECGRECEARLGWWRAIMALHQELGCKPWEIPCVRRPDYVAESKWGRLAQARWRALEAALVA